MTNRLTKIVIFSLLLFLAITPSFAMGKKDLSFKHPGDLRPTGISKGSMESCQAREASIKTRMNSLVKLADNMETKFSSISARVQKFYTNKVVSSGKTVSNYNQLVLDIQTKKDSVSSSLSAAQNDVNNFSCSTQNPKSDLTKFREDMKNVKSALKDYRTAIKNLIVAVKTAVGEGKESPTP